MERTFQKHFKAPLIISLFTMVRDKLANADQTMLEPLEVAHSFIRTSEPSHF